MAMYGRNINPETGEFIVDEHKSSKNLDDQGREVPDSRPMAPPIGYHRQPSMVELIRNMAAGELLRREATAAGYESFEEADDFDVDDFDPSSPYEAEFEPVRAVRARKEVAEAEEAAVAAQGGSGGSSEGSGGAGGGTPPA